MSNLRTGYLAGRRGWPPLAAYVRAWDLPRDCTALRRAAMSSGPPPAASSQVGTWRVARAAGPFGGGGDVPEHAAEDDAVKRRNGPPVSMTCEPARPEDRPLAVGGHPVIVLAHRQLQPGQARQLHLRTQPQQSSRLDRLYPPEIQGVTGEQMPGVAAAAA